MREQKLNKEKNWRIGFISILCGLILFSGILLFGCSSDNVSKPKVLNVSISAQPTKIEYNIGDKISLAGAKVKVAFSDDSYLELDAQNYCDLSGIDMTIAGIKPIECKFQYDNKEYQFWFYINVKDPPEEKRVVNVGISSQPNKTVYEVGETINLTGAKIKVSFSNNSYLTLDAQNYCDLSGIDMTTMGNKQIPCSLVYDGVSYSLWIHIEVVGKGESASAVYETMLTNLSNSNEYTLSGIFGEERDVEISFKQLSSRTTFQLVEGLGTYIFDNDLVYFDFGTEKYQSSNMTYAEFLKSINFEIADESHHPLQMISTILSEAQDDQKTVSKTSTGYILSFTHKNPLSLNGPALPSGNVVLNLDLEKHLLNAKITSPDGAFNVTINYQTSITIPTGCITVDKHFFAIKRAIIIDSEKEKWDFYVNKDDGPENYYYEKLDGKEYFAYKRVHYSDSYNEDCYYFYEDGTVYYYDVTNENAFMWRGVSADDFCSFMQSSDKLNLLGGMLNNFDISSISGNIDYKECYNVDQSDPSIHHDSCVYGANAKVNFGEESQDVYVVMELDGGNQLRNVYLYTSKEDADADKNYDSEGRINGWGAQKGQLSLVNTSIGFYVVQLPKHEFILQTHGVNLSEISWIDKTGLPLTRQ